MDNAEQRVVTLEQVAKALRDATDRMAKATAPGAWDAALLMGREVYAELLDVSRAAGEK